MKKNLVFTAFLFLYSFNLFAQNLKYVLLKGRVITNNKTPVAVLLKARKGGMNLCNADGEFMLQNVLRNDTIIFEGIGLKKVYFPVKRDYKYLLITIPVDTLITSEVGRSSNFHLSPIA